MVQLALSGWDIADRCDQRRLADSNPRPVDLIESVEETGRLVVADPAHKVCSAASEIASIVSDEGFWSLQAPIKKVASKQVHVPYSPSLEKLVYPTADSIVDAVRETLG